MFFGSINSDVDPQGFALKSRGCSPLPLVPRLIGDDSGRSTVPIDLFADGLEVRSGVGEGDMCCCSCCRSKSLWGEIWGWIKWKLAISLDMYWILLVYNGFNWFKSGTAWSRWNAANWAAAIDSSEVIFVSGMIFFSKNSNCFGMKFGCDADSFDCFVGWWMWGLSKLWLESSDSMICCGKSIMEKIRFHPRVQLVDTIQLTCLLSSDSLCSAISPVSLSFTIFPSTQK